MWHKKRIAFRSEGRNHPEPTAFGRVIRKRPFILPAILVVECILVPARYFGIPPTAGCWFTKYMSFYVLLLLRYSPPSSAPFDKVGCFHQNLLKIYLNSYGFVSLSLCIIGVVFTIFAVFQKDSVIGRVWLAGPVLMVVAGVLCGKVPLPVFPPTE